MSRIADSSGIGRLICGLALALCVPLGAHAKGFRVLHAFAGGNDGGVPSGDLIADKPGNLYGTTASDGAELLQFVASIKRINIDETVHALIDEFKLSANLDTRFDEM
ncbi:MAG: hypothetical protein ACREHF_08460 [Rhizomicrobium sp.]